MRNRTVRLLLAGESDACYSFLHDLQKSDDFINQRFLENGVLALSTKAGRQIELLQLKHEDDSFQGIIYLCVGSSNKAYYESLCAKLSSISKFSQFDCSTEKETNPASIVRIMTNKVLREPHMLPRLHRFPATYRISIHNGDTLNADSSAPADYANKIERLDAMYLPKGEKMVSAVTLKGLFSQRRDHYGEQASQKAGFNHDRVLPSEIKISAKVK